MLSVRLQKEAKVIYTEHKDTLELNIVDPSKNVWHIKFKGTALYEGETFTL